MRSVAAARYFVRSERFLPGRSATLLSVGSCDAVRVVVGIAVNTPCGEEEFYAASRHE
jgi:hypothetical protein